MNIIDVQNVTKRFDKQTALQELSLQIERGRIFGLLGPNGAGKTTLIRLLTGIYVPDNGRILFNGHPLTPADVAHIGYLPEERGLYKKMKVSEQCIYLARLRGLTKKDAEQRLRAWFRKFGIEAWWNRNVEELSKGMQQKIQFIITVAHQPDFLIFDEPFSGFDPVNAEMLKSEITELRRDGATIILSTHNMASVEAICDDIALLNHGRAVLTGPLNEVRRHHSLNRYAITFTAPDNSWRSSLPSPCTLVSHETIEQSERCQIQISNDFTSNDLLHFFISHTQVISFHEIIPSMNEIFIRTVTEQNEPQ